MANDGTYSPSTPVVLDTDVWSCLFGNSKSHSLEQIQSWREFLDGKIAVIAVQTRAEVLVGLTSLGDNRARPIRAALESLPTHPITEAVIQSYVSLTQRSRQVGHPLHQKIHTGDRWIAATAAALGAPLLTGDHMFRGAPGLTVVDL